MCITEDCNDEDTPTRVEFFYYEGANHAFCDYTRPNLYRPEAAALSKSRMLQFLKKNLK